MADTSTLRDPGLAEEGRKKIEWVKNRMDILNEILREREQARPLAGMNVAIALHLEAKTAYMAVVLQKLGAHVAICGSNPLSTQDDVAAGLASMGVEVHSWYNATPEEYVSFLDKVLDTKPDLVIDDGGDLVERKGKQEVVWGCVNYPDSRYRQRPREVEEEENSST